MKITSDEHGILERLPQVSKWFIGVQQGVSILTAQVDGDHARGDETILLKNVVCDDLSDLKQGMSVSIGALEQRNRKVSAVFISYNSGTLILTIGPNAVRAGNDLYVTVYSVFRLWKLDEPAWGGSIHIEPFAIMGPPRAGFVGEPMAFVGIDSYSPVGRTISAYQWKKFNATFVSGDLSAANTEASPLVLRWDTAGEYLVKLKVTDSAGEVGYSFRPVLIYDRTGANAPYSAAIIKNPQFSGNGWSASFTAYGVADENEFPPEAQIVVFAEDWYGTIKNSIGGAYRGAGNIVMTGWINETSIMANSADKSVSFTLDSVDALMQRLRMPSYTFRDGNDTTDWKTYTDLSLDKIACYLIQQRTTLALVADVFLAIFDFQLGLLDVPRDSLFAQLSQSIVADAAGFVRGSRFGSITIARDRNMLTGTMRSYLNTASVQFTSKDWLGLEVREEKFASTARVILKGLLSDDTVIVARWPSTGPGHNGEIVTIEGLFFDSQAQANELAERLYRKRNRRVKGVSMQLVNWRVLEPAFQEYFTIILQAEQNKRGYDWDNSMNGDMGREFICTGMSINLNNGYSTVQIEGETSVFGAHGADWDLPSLLPTLEWLPGYGQGPSTTGDGLQILLDNASETLTDDSDIKLTEGA